MSNDKKSRFRTDIEKVCKKLDIDFLGVASLNRFRNAPQLHRPQDLLPDAQSVVSVGLRIPDGVSEANRRAFEIDGMRHSIYIYQMHGYVLLNEKLNQTVLTITRYLEKRGYKSTPIPASRPSDSYKKMGVFSNRHAAVAAGLATFGWNSLAITSQAGPRVRWASVLTSASLPPDLLQEEEICNGCHKCVGVCPVNAIPTEESVDLEIEDRIYEYSKLNKWRCSIGGTSGFSTKLSRKSFKISDDPGPKEYLRALDFEDHWQKMERIGSMCGRCIIECPVGSSQ